MNLTSFFIIYLMIFFAACNNDSSKCKEIQEYKVKNYKIVKMQCPDLVLAYYYQYKVIDINNIQGTASKVDSCVFTWQVKNESLLILNTCNNTVQEYKPVKKSLDTKSIDSVIIFSKEFRQTKRLTSEQIENFAKDWNNSITRNYSDKPFDSAFFHFPAYQYKLTVYSKGIERPFYGYNYLILDSSNWIFEMGKSNELNYFHNYWQKN